MATILVYALLAVAVALTLYVLAAGWVVLGAFRSLPPPPPPGRAPVAAHSRHRPTRPADAVEQSPHP
jgi:hypothetical protein